MILQVIIGENLNYTVGRLRYSSDTGANPTASDTSEITTTTIIILSVITAVMAFIVMLLVIIIICVVRMKSKKNRVLHSLVTLMLACMPLQVMVLIKYSLSQDTEPGLDHLYDRVDDFCEENNTKLQATASPADGDKIDAEGYLNPPCEVVDHAATEGNEGDTGSHSEFSKEYGRTADDEHYTLANGNDEHDNQQKKDSLQLKANNEDTLM